MEERIFENIGNKLGFGCMRLPVKDGGVDLGQTKEMVDIFLANGFKYFDTAHGYIVGKSETALKECLTKRYPREAYIIADKLSDPFFKAEEEIRPFFESQLLACGVKYFDYYLMHAQNAVIFEKYKECRAYETAFELKKEGKVRHVGLSFHDKAEVLEQILEEYPEIEFVQLQFNYLDYDSVKVQSGRCYDICVKHGKPVIVMEPVKGGKLANLPEEAGQVLKRLGGGSNASYAIRYAAGFDNVALVLSGMSTMEQMRDNISFMQDFKPLTWKECEALSKVSAILKEQEIIACTGCKYCTGECPKHVLIPEIFSLMNERVEKSTREIKNRYRILTADGGKASDCVRCGRCEKSCPQGLKIMELLGQAAGILEE